ncbi:hypothetical protein ACTA71_008442 [Dictyostelium dimigraforme]
MGKGGHTCSNNYCQNELKLRIPIIKDDIKPQLPPSTINKQTLKKIKNNNKKQKKMEKKLNQFEFLNIFEIDKNNISFSSSSSTTSTAAAAATTNDEEEINSNKLNNSINNNNYKENKSNIIIEKTPDLIENDELVIEKKEKEEEEKEERKQFEEEQEEEEEETLFLELEKENEMLEDGEFNKIFESIGNLNEIGEEYEYQLTNKKTCLFKRIRKDNKKPKPSKRPEKAIEVAKEGRKRFWLSFHYEKQLDKRPKDVKMRQFSFNGIGREDSYEVQLRKALSLSKSEYDRQVKKEVTPLSQQQINDILNRELTPEDYELLLLLDETIKPKTIDEDDIDKLPTVKFDTELLKQFSTCMICLSDFDLGESITKLPCSHIFHINCISNWLSNASTKCPIDNIPIVN